MLHLDVKVILFNLILIDFGPSFGVIYYFFFFFKFLLIIDVFNMIIIS